MPSKVIIVVIAARAKMSLSRAQNIFMPVNINSIVIVVTIWPVFILSDVSLAVAVVIAKAPFYCERSAAVPAKYGQCSVLAE